MIPSGHIRLAFCLWATVAALTPVRAAEKPADAETLAAEARDSIVILSVGGRDGGVRGFGTGFVISKDGLIATNLHVIGEARPITVKLADGRQRPVTAVHASDRGLDLAVIRIDADDLKPLRLGDSDDVRQGQSIVALGNPQGLGASVVRGVLSAAREVEQRRMLQLAIPIQPGNSGGPILDAEGRVLGIVTMKSRLDDNLGFAVPVNDLKPLLERPNPVPMKNWLTIGALDPQRWTAKFGADWQQRGGLIEVSEPGRGFGGRSLCLSAEQAPEAPYELAVTVRLDDESGAAGLAFASDGEHKHYGFYPSGGSLRLTRFEGPTVYTWRVLSEIRTPHYRPGDWNRLKVRLEKDVIRCYVNGELVIEHRDDRARTGRLGLAKFRQTEAAFKRFAVGRELSDDALPPAVAQAMNEAVDRAPTLAEASDASLKALLDRPDAGVRVLRQRAKRMERRAEELRRLADTVHAMTVAARLKAELDQGEDEADLLRIALHIASLDEPEIDLQAYHRQVRAMARRASEGLDDQADAATRLAALDRFFFEQRGYHGSRTEYYHRANSRIHRVIDDREGLPITLSVLYMEVGRRMGLTLQGVGLPGHFVVRHPPDENLIDVFQRGKRLTPDDTEQMVLEFAGRPVQARDTSTARKKDIALRMLHNLLGSAREEADQAAMGRYLECLVTLDPQDAGTRGMRAVMRFENGLRDAAIADLDHLLDQQPQGLDLGRIRRMRTYFESGKP